MSKEKNFDKAALEKARYLKDYLRSQDGIVNNPNVIGIGICCEIDENGKNIVDKPAIGFRLKQPEKDFPLKHCDRINGISICIEIIGSIKKQKREL